MTREITHLIERSPSTVSRELTCNAATRGGKLEYRASVAQWKSELLADPVLRRPVESAQYASDAHQALITKHGPVRSMSRKGNCWDNSVMERFFLNLKMERIWQRDYANHAVAMSDIADYIVSFYNSARLHSTLGNLPPNAFEQKSASNQLIDVSEIT